MRRLLDHNVVQRAAGTFDSSTSGMKLWNIFSPSRFEQVQQHAIYGYLLGVEMRGW